jgi:hypothetical protein
VKFKNEAGYGFLELDDDSRTDIFVNVRDCEHEVPLAVVDSRFVCAKDAIGWSGAGEEREGRGATLPPKKSQRAAIEERVGKADSLPLVQRLTELYD